MFKNSAKLLKNKSSNIIIERVLNTSKRLDEVKIQRQSLPKVIGIYGGAFDPIHVAHLEVVLAAKSTLSLDEVRILPCYQPAYGKKPVASAFDRLRMVELAVAGKEGLIVDNCEYQRKTASKTIDTLKILHERFPDATLCLIIGMDNLISFTTWHQWEEILTLAHLVVAGRPGYILPNEGKIAELLEKKGTNEVSALQNSKAGSVIFFSAPQLEVSSTFVRAALAEGKDSKQIPREVQDYILKHHLYMNFSVASQKYDEYKPYKMTKL